LFLLHFKPRVDILGSSLNRRDKNLRLSSFESSSRKITATFSKRQGGRHAINLKLKLLFGQID
jgi:hypothetical protein